MDTGLELVTDVRARYGRLQSDALCECGPCLAAGCDEPPILVPDHRERDGSGSWFEMGRWIHGYELQKHIQARRAFTAAWAAHVPKPMSSRDALRRVK